jgi:O-antigen ligase
VFTRFDVSAYGLTKAIFLGILTLILVSGWIVKILLSAKVRIVRTPTDLAVLAFALVALLSTVFSPYFAASLWGRYREHQGLITLLNYTLIFFLVTNFAGREKVFPKAILSLFLSAGLISMYAVFQHYGLDIVSYQETPFQEMRSWSTLGNPIFVGGYLTMVIPFVFAYLTLADSSIWRKLPMGILLLLTVAALLFTRTRAAWVGVIIALVFVLVNFAFEPRRRMARLGRLVLTVAVLAFFIILLAVFGQSSSSLGERFLSIFSLHFEGGRVTLWLSLLPVLLGKPLLGSGPNTFHIVSHLGGSGGAHNEYLNMVATLGFLGFGAFLAILVSLFLVGWRHLRSKNAVGDWASVGLFAGLLAYLIHLLFSFSSIGGSLPFWFLLALAAARLQRRTHEAEATKITSGLRAILLVLLVANFMAVAVFVKVFAADVYFAQAARMEREGQIEKSISANEMAARLNPGEEQYTSALGQRYLVLSEAGPEREVYITRARESFEKSLVLNPNSKEARLGLGVTLVSAGRIEEAFRQWKRVLAFDPTQSDAYWYIGQTYERLGMLEEAARAYVSVLKIDPEDLDARLALEELGQGP